MRSILLRRTSIILIYSSESNYIQKYYVEQIMTIRKEYLSSSCMFIYGSVLYVENALKSGWSVWDEILSLSSTCTRMILWAKGVYESCSCCIIPRAHKISSWKHLSLVLWRKKEASSFLERKDTQKTLKYGFLQCRLLCLFTLLQWIQILIFCY